MIERVLGLASLDDAAYRDSKLRAFRAVLVMGIATGYQLERLASFRAWAPQFDRDVLINALPGPYAVDSILVKLMSNAVWIGEIVFAPMMLIGRTRVIGVIGALAVLFVIEAGAREIVFGVLYTNLLLLFVVRDVNRKLLPVFAALYLLVIVARTGVLPFEVPL